jgi:hypothetical protein
VMCNRACIDRLITLSATASGYESNWNELHCVVFVYPVTLYTVRLDLEPEQLLSVSVTVARTATWWRNTVGTKWTLTSAVLPC